MVSYKCPKCAFSFNQADKAWDKAIETGVCPNCSSSLIDFAVTVKIPGNNKPRSLKRIEHWVLLITGFIIGTIVAVGSELGILFIINELSNHHYIPRGIGWILLPVSLGAAVGLAMPRIWLRIQDSITLKIKSASLLMRVAITLSLFLIFCVSTYVYLFEPYGYMDNLDYNHMLKVTIFPIFVFWIGIFLYSKIVISNTDESSHDKT